MYYLVCASMSYKDFVYGISYSIIQDQAFIKFFQEASINGRLLRQA